MLKIECLVNGYLSENCYIIHNNKNALIVDPGSEEDIIYECIKKLKLNVVGILVTHYHFDHVLVLDKVKEKYNVLVYDYNSESEVSISDFNFSIIKNYGHTMDSVSFYFKNDKIMFTGDFVFKGSIGKYDFENENIMYESLKKFIKLPNDIKVFPGHGEESSVEEEKKYNYFLRGL